MDDPRRALSTPEDSGLDPNEVAAYVAGRMTPVERAAFLARTGADPEAQLLIRALREDARPRSGRVWMFATAAVVLVAVGIAWFARGGDAPGDVSERLSVAAADLTRRAPDLFGSFTPLGADELAASESTTRGGARWVAPRGQVLAAPPELRWENAAGSEEVEVSIEGPGVRWDRTLRGDHAPAPVLPPGRYVVTVRAVGSLAGQESRFRFAVADAAARSEFERAVQAIRQDAPADLRDLLVAHFALRRGFREEARVAAVRALEGSDGVREAAEALLRHLGETPRP